MKVRLLEKKNPSDIKRFKQLPFKLYQENPYWVPPLDGEIENVMNPEKHPFYRHSEGDFFVVEREKEVLGRIAVLHNKNYCSFHDEKTAFFYYFESVNDPEVASLLFASIEAWATARGLNKVFGPRGFLRSNGIGLLVEGFNFWPAVGIPYNHDYYGALIEGNGYTKSHDYFSGYLDKHPDPQIHTIAEKVLARGNFSIVDFKHKSEMEDWIPRIEEVHHKAFAHNPSYYPSTKEEFDQLARNIIAVADPRFIKLIKYKDEIAGFVIGYPNINRALKRANGKLFPLGWLYILLENKFPQVLDLNGVGIMPEYQGLGGNVLLYSELDKVTRQAGSKMAEIVQVDERNFRSKSDMETLGVNFTKVHRTYQKDI